MVASSVTVLEVQPNESSELNSSIGYGVDRDYIRQAVEYADANVLRIVLLQLTKDPELASMCVTRLDIRGGAIIDFVLPKDDQAKVKAKTLDYLLQGPYDGLPPSPPSKEEAFRLMDLYSGVPMASKHDSSFDYEEGFEELSFPDFPRDVKWTGNSPPEDLGKWKVIIIGAGVSGIAAAIPLKRLGIPFEIIERQSGIGGTWLLNRYPNVRVDSPSSLYQFSYTKNYKWKEQFPTGNSIKDYLEYVASTYGIKETMKFNREVLKAQWNETESQWEIAIKHKDGTEETLVCNFIISCSGLFSTPNLPDINGLASYTRPVFHTSQFNEVDYHGKDIALIGTGSSGPSYFHPVLLCLLDRKRGWQSVSVDLCWLFCLLSPQLKKIEDSS
jgi:4-hydroxyacetophenone monooxygenase